MVENIAPQTSKLNEFAITKKDDETDPITDNCMVSLKNDQQTSNLSTNFQNQDIKKVLPQKRKYTRKMKKTNEIDASNADEQIVNEKTQLGNSSKLIRHYTRKIEKSTNTTKERKIYPTKKSPCEFCGKLMVMKDLKEHLNTHYGK